MRSQAIHDWIAGGAVWPDSVGTFTARFESQRRGPRVLGVCAAGRCGGADHGQRRMVARTTSIVSFCRACGRPTCSRSRKPIVFTLVRRLYYDLVGASAESRRKLRRSCSDDDPQAYERLVDDLLNRPEYGERWARHWLDLVRYAESDGFKADVYRPHAWIYRDYVVRSLNDDKPYDRFLQEQLAGDELFPDDPQARVATGYLRLWPLEDNQKDVQRQWTLVLDDVTEVTSEVVLGLGIRCAKCHDHKYDPIPQADYYRLRAFFAAHASAR